MLMGIKLRAYPTQSQQKTFSQWRGCSRFIWIAQCEEDKYLSTFGRKYMPLGTHAPIDQKFSHYKCDTLSPWLSECPSEILRVSFCSEDGLDLSHSNSQQDHLKFLKGSEQKFLQDPAIGIDRGIVRPIGAGTELSKRGVLLAETGRRAKPKPCGAKGLYAHLVEASKKKRIATKAA